MKTIAILLLGLVLIGPAVSQQIISPNKTTTLKFEWDAYPDALNENIVGYNIYMSTNYTDWEKVGTSNTNSITVTNKINGWAVFAITAFNSALLESPKSLPIHVKAPSGWVGQIAVTTERNQ
jgi:hypothetical protein